MSHDDAKLFLVYFLSVSGVFDVSKWGKSRYATFRTHKNHCYLLSQQSMDLTRFPTQVYTRARAKQIVLFESF